MDYNFSVAPVDPSQAIAQFSGSAQQNANLATQSNLQMQQNKVALQKQMLSQTILGRAMGPNGTGQDWATLSQLIDPAAFQAANSHWQTVKTNQQQDALQAAGSTWAALMNDSPEVAKSITQARIEAMSNQPGGGDKTQLAFLNGILQTIEKDPKVAAAQLGIGLSTMPGGKDAMDAYYKQGSLGADNTKTLAEADKATAEADYRRQSADADIANTKAQTRSYDATAALDELKAKYAGNGKLMDPKDVLQAEADFRKEYSTQTAYFQQVHQYYSNILASPATGGATGASDIALVYNYMKMLDPGSVVREGEYATAQNSGGVPAQVLSVYNSIVNGQKLTPAQRQNMIAQAKMEYGQALSKEKTVRDGITRIATAKGLNPDNLFYEPGGVSEPKAPGYPAAVPGTANPGSAAPVAVPDAPPPGSVVRKKR